MFKIRNVEKPVQSVEHSLQTDAHVDAITMFSHTHCNLNMTSYLLVYRVMKELGDLQGHNYFIGGFIDQHSAWPVTWTRAAQGKARPHL